VMENLKNIIDSLLFVAEETLSLDRLKKILPQADARAAFTSRRWPEATSSAAGRSIRRGSGAWSTPSRCG
jgi:chromosome segregation and condensation protein ScpB